MMSPARQALYHNAPDCRQHGQHALYARALERGRRGQLWSGFSRTSRGLLSLEEISQAGTVQARSSGETCMVAIAHICGSENRAADFDCDFNPLQDRTRDRWLGIASALQRGRCLPPVALIQVCDRYFVRDGHHRISVAKALGQKTIEATVEVWQAGETLPWEQMSQASSRRHARNHEGPSRLVRGSRPALILGWLSGLLRLPGRPAASQIAR